MGKRRPSAVGAVQGCPHNRSASGKVRARGAVLLLPATCRTLHRMDCGDGGCGGGGVEAFGDVAPGNELDWSTQPRGPAVRRASSCLQPRLVPAMLSHAVSFFSSPCTGKTKTQPPPLTLQRVGGDSSPAGQAPRRSWWPSVPVTLRRAGAPARLRPSTVDTGWCS